MVRRGLCSRERRPTSSHEPYGRKPTRPTGACGFRRCRPAVPISCRPLIPIEVGQGWRSPSGWLVSQVLAGGVKRRLHGRRSSAGFRRAGECDVRCGRDGRGWRRPGSARRRRHDAPVVDGVIHEVEVTDPTHPLFGLRLAVASPASSRGPGWVAVLLSDGRRRHLPVAATGLGGECPAVVGVVSARTLVPAAALAQALSARRREETRDGESSTGSGAGRAGAAPPAVAGDAARPAPADRRGRGGHGGVRGPRGGGGDR
jgi:hypothetical protein